MPTLSELVAHVSTDMSKRIRKHFVSNGELRALVHFTRFCAWETPSPDEIRGVAEYLHKQRTSSTAPIWQELLELATGTDAEFVKNRLSDVEAEEVSDGMPL